MNPLSSWQAESSSASVFHGTTILSVRRGASVAMGGDGQVTLGSIEARWVPVSVQQSADAAMPKDGAHPVRFIVERVARGAEGAREIVEPSTFVVPR